MAVRVAELVDGVMQQLLSVWDKLEPVALGGSGMSGAGAALQMPADADGEGHYCFRIWRIACLSGLIFVPNS